MTQKPIVPEDSTFSRYFDLPYETGDVLRELGYEFETQALTLPTAASAPGVAETLGQEIQENLTLVDPTSETARREALIFPVLRSVCRSHNLRLRIEYPIRVDDRLRGTLDYFIPDGQSLLVVEAKQADLSRGFTQLAVELIALAQWQSDPAELLYGAITTGETWKFGILERRKSLVIKDTNTYSIPINLNLVLSILNGIVAPVSRA